MLYGFCFEIWVFSNEQTHCKFWVPSNNIYLTEPHQSINTYLDNKHYNIPDRCPSYTICERTWQYIVIEICAASYVDAIGNSFNKRSKGILLKHMYL